MQPLTRIAPRLRAAVALQRGLRTVAPLSASVASPGRAGPPPAAPATDPEKYERAKKRKKQAEMLREVKEGKGKGLKRRFWKEVTVREVDGRLSLVSLPRFTTCYTSTAPSGGKFVFLRNGC